MLINRMSIYIIVFLCLSAIYSLFVIKNNVITLRMEMEEVNSQIHNEIDSIHLLKAEFAYLSSPERLKSLNKEYLKLEDTKMIQMASDPLKAKQEKNTVRLSSNTKNLKNSTSWCYKSGSKKYLKMASSKT